MSGWKKVAWLLMGFILCINCAACNKQKEKTIELVTGKTLFHADLVFHVLNYIPLKDLPADLYSEDYIDTFEAYRTAHDNNYDLIGEAGKLSAAYKKYFNEVSCIAFIGFEYGSYEEMKTYLKQATFSPAAREAFIEPFIACMEAEKNLYKSYWETRISQEKKNMQAFLEYSNQKFSPLEKIFTYAGKKPCYYFCVSLCGNKGRGINDDHMLVAAGQIPKNNKEYQDVFFRAFHEMTHQITDRKVFSYTSMNDDTHLQSEKVVIMADYLLLQKYEKALLEAYIKWDAKGAGVSDTNEQEFLKVYQLSDRHEKKLQEIMQEIAKV